MFYVSLASSWPDDLGKVQSSLNCFKRKRYYPQTKLILRDDLYYVKYYIQFVLLLVYDVLDAQTGKFPFILSFTEQVVLLTLSFSHFFRLSTAPLFQAWWLPFLVTSQQVIVIVESTGLYYWCYVLILNICYSFSFYRYYLDLYN